MFKDLRFRMNRPGEFMLEKEKVICKLLFTREREVLEDS